MSNKISTQISYSESPELIQMASNKIFGFWIYLMSDCVLFATLFTTFAVLSSSHNTGSQTTSNLFNLQHVLIETLCLLTSSFTFGLAIHAMNQAKRKSLITWLSITFVLGLSFIYLEINEFYHFIQEGKGPEQNAFMSSFFSLVGTHGLHVSFGLLWIGVMITQVFRKGISLPTQTRLILLGLFWHFLDIIWICIFTFVYLIGSL